MADESNESPDPEEQPIGAEEQQEPEIWDWARAAGVSREDLLRALERSRTR